MYTSLSKIIELYKCKVSTLKLCFDENVQTSWAKSTHFSQAKRKKASKVEKPAKKQKGGESSKPSGSAKSNDDAGDNMFQVKQYLCSGVARL